MLACDALETTEEQYAFTVFKRVFEEFGLPAVIRMDNGVPFSSRGLFGLSKLSVWWLRLGIAVEDKVWLVSFMDYDLGYFDEQTCKLEPLDNPFGPRVLSMSSV